MVGDSFDTSVELLVVEMKWFRLAFFAPILGKSTIRANIVMLEWIIQTGTLGATILLTCFSLCSRKSGMIRIRRFFCRKFLVDNGYMIFLVLHFDVTVKNTAWWLGSVMHVSPKPLCRLQIL